MASEDTKILEFNQYQKSYKAPFVIYADFECLIEKIDGRKNNPENPYTTKEGKHIRSGFSVSAISSFKSIEKSMMYTEVVTMRKFCESLREHALKIIDFKKKK